MSGVCPKCEKVVTRLKINGVEGQVPFGSTWKCITLCCPLCNTVLSAQIDPVAIKTDIVNALKAR